MEELTTQMGPAAAALVGIVATIVQQFKRFPAIISLQKKLPVYQILSLGLGILGAHLFGIANPIFAGVLVGLSSGGAYDTVKNVEVPNVAKTIVPILLVMLLFVGCAENLKPTAWLLSGTDASNIDGDADMEYIGRVGVQAEQTEFGLTSSWFQGDPRQAYGAYAIQFLPIDPNSLLGTPYIGGQATLDLKTDGGMYGFITGTILNIGGIEVVIEFTARSYSEVYKEQFGESENKYRLFAGPRFKF